MCRGWLGGCVSLSSENAYISRGFELLDLCKSLIIFSSSGEIKIHQQYPQHDFEIILKDFNGKNILRKIEVILWVQFHLTLFVFRILFAYQSKMVREFLSKPTNFVVAFELAQ